MSDIFINRGTKEISEQEAILELGESFVRTIEHIRNIANFKNCFLLIHGTRVESCLDIINDSRGLIHYENDYTSTMSSFSSYADLYNIGLVNGTLPDGFIILMIPKQCFRSDLNQGLWHTLILNKHSYKVEIDDTCSLDDVSKYSIPKEYIFGFIDLENKKIVQNSGYDSNYRNSKLVLDAHTVCGLMDIREENAVSTITNKHL
ncbi:MAG: hypothetical protein OSJ65_02315 [Bacilli bacterium]|nr:hypothetical protein [Bacilli bacterium]